MESADARRLVLAVACSLTVLPSPTGTFRWQTLAEDRELEEIAKKHIKELERQEKKKQEEKLLVRSRTARVVRENRFSGACFGVPPCSRHPPRVLRRRPPRFGWKARTSRRRSSTRSRRASRRASACWCTTSTTPSRHFTPRRRLRSAFSLSLTRDVFFASLSSGCCEAQGGGGRCAREREEAQVHVAARGGGACGLTFFCGE